MTRPKHYSPSSAHLHTPVCTVQLACDGINLVGAARERGYCVPCGEAAKKRGRVIAPHGENLEVQRRTILKKGDE